MALGQGDPGWSLSQLFLLGGHVALPGYVTFLNPVQTRVHKQGCHYLPHHMAMPTNGKSRGDLYTRMALGSINLHCRGIFFSKIVNRYFGLCGS